MRQEEDNYYYVSKKDVWLMLWVKCFTDDLMKNEWFANMFVEVMCHG